jgi:hypothetical protein
MDRIKAVGFSENMLAFIFNLVSEKVLEANYGWLISNTGHTKVYHRVAF